MAARAKELGLIDGIGYVVPVLKERFGEKTRFKEYSQKKSLSQRFGVSIANDAISLVEERANLLSMALKYDLKDCSSFSNRDGRDGHVWKIESAKVKLLNSKRCDKCGKFKIERLSMF